MCSPVPLGVSPAPELARGGHRSRKLAPGLEATLADPWERHHRICISEPSSILPAWGISHLFPVAVDAFVSGWRTLRIPSALGAEVPVSVPQARL